MSWQVVWLIFLKNRTYILIKDKLLLVSKHGFFWSEENVNLNYFPTQDGVTVLVCPVILWTLNILLLYFMADVMPCSLACDMLWQMLLPNLWQMLLLVCGRCYNHQAEGIACIIKQGGSCYCHIFVCGTCYANPVYML